MNSSAAQIFHSYLSRIWSADHTSLWIIPIILFTWGLSGLLPKILGAVGELEIRSLLQEAKIDSVHDLVLPDDRGGLTQIDHLALLPWGVAVIETKFRAGAIYGTTNDRYWTVRAHGQSSRLYNPLRQNYKHVKSVRRISGGVPVKGFVVFTGKCKFPKGMPEGVIKQKKLIENLKQSDLQEVDHPALVNAWNSVIAANRTDRASRRAHLKDLHKRYGGGLRAPASFGILAIAALMAIGLWLT